MTALAPNFTLQLEDLIANDRRERLGRFDPNVLTWLAIVPEWTERGTVVAPGALDVGFPLPTTSYSSFGEFLDRAASARIIDRRAVLDATGNLTTAFWVPASVRPDIGRHLRDTRSRDELEASVNAVVNAFKSPSGGSSSGSPVALSGALKQWLDVAAKGRDPSGSWLIEQVGSSVAGGRVTEARDYVAAATALGDVLGDPLSSAARRAQWRIDRGYREAQDNRHLEHYHHRPEFETALDELVWGPPETWALHLLGKGGVGKTTLVRYLSSGRFAAERRRPPLPVARIDFDHLDPRYPEQRPAELLMALVGDLSGFTLSRSAYAAMRQVDDASQAVHELLGATSEQSDAESMLAVAIAAFARYLQELRGPVVLVLDTCEELAKLHAPGAVAPAVERTFHILESIHRAVPTVRVLFAGRRWLSQPPPGTAAAASGPMLRARPYLRVLEIGGFTAREAGEYIDRRDPQAGIPAALRAAMLDRCREEDAASAEPRFNPFDLDGYCDWAVAEPDLDPDTLRSAPGDPYIDQRIIGRLGSTTLRDALPVVVEFGRFDLDMVTPALNRRAIEPEVAFNGFANQEWVSTVQYTAEGLPRIIEINEHLRARLRAVIGADPESFPLNRRLLGSDLAELLDRAPLDQLSVEAVGAAVRLLRPDEAGVCWAKLERRITLEDKWAWAGTMTPVAAGVEASRVAIEGPTIMAAIRATQAAATLRVKGRAGLRGLWEEVSFLAQRHPDPHEGSVLLGRAMCGLLATAPERAAELVMQGALTEGLSHALPPRASLLAALESLVPVHRDSVAYDAVSASIDGLCEVDEPEIATAARLTRAIARLNVHDLAGAADDVERALRTVGGTGRGKWADWIVPARLEDRCRLARLVVALARGEQLEAVPWATWRDEAQRHIGNIDAERLVSAALNFELAHRLPDIETLERLYGLDKTYVPDRRASAWWHTIVPPLAVTLARGFAALSLPDQAEILLTDRREQAVAASDDRDTIVACESALLSLSRTYRSIKLSELVRRYAPGEGAEAERGEAWAVLALTQGVTPETPADAGSWHNWWRAQVRRPFPSPPLPLAPPDARWEIGPESGLMADLARLKVAVDLVELAILRDEPPRDGEATRAMHRDLVVGGQLLQGSGAVLGTVLRADVLDLDRRLVTEDVLEPLPPRLVAEVALAEGELLALRLPAPAGELFALARDRFTAARDDFGAARATILRVLALARAGRPTEGITTPPQMWPADSAGTWWQGWMDRQVVTMAVLNHDPSPPVWDGMPPEVDVRPLAASESVAPREPAPVVMSYPSTPNMEPPPLAPPFVVPSPSARRSAGPLASVKDALATAAGLAVVTLMIPRVWATIMVLLLLLILTGPTLVLINLVNLVLPIGWAIPLGIVALLGLLALGVLAWLWRSRPRLQEKTVSFVLGSTRSTLEVYLCDVSVARAGNMIVDNRQLLFSDAFDGQDTVRRWDTSRVPSERLGHSGKYLPIPVNLDSSVDLPWEQLIGTLPGRFQPLWVRWSGNGAWSLSGDWATRVAIYRGSPHIAPAAHHADRLPEPEPVTRVSEPALRTLHLVGTPVQTTAGWRFRVVGATSEATQVVTARTISGEELLSADRLPLRNTALVVLQAEPVDGPPQPLGELRAGLVGFGMSTVASTGANALLIIPPLPDALAAKTTELIWSRIAAHKQAPDGKELLTLFGDLRTMVAQAEQVAPGGERASLDVLLVLR